MSIAALLGRLGLLLALAGCAHVEVAVAPETFNTVEPVREFRLDGRLAVKTASQNLSGSLAWRRAGGEEVLLLSGPLGQGAVEMRRQDGMLVLRLADGTELSDASDEALMERAIGLRLPLAGLVWWLSALPRPGAEFAATAAGDGRLASLEQDGWRIEYGRYRQLDGRWLPGRIFARQGELEFRLVVDAWEAL